MQKFITFVSLSVEAKSMGMGLGKYEAKRIVNEAKQSETQWQFYLTVA
jgi:hypothetical protein